MKFTLNCRGRLLDLSTPAIMAVLNITPDSFHRASRIQEADSVLKAAEKFLLQGAAIIDIGAQSSRQGAEFLNAEQEWSRLENILPILAKEFPDAIISIDTFHSIVAKRAVDEGCSIINDISAGNTDERMLQTVAELKVPYILMHMQGTPATMQKNPHYKNVVTEVMDFFDQKLSVLKSLGTTDILLDPGFGFGKLNEHNYALLKNLNAFSIFGMPVVAGLSRKSMITRILDIRAEEALNGTSVLNTLAILNGASILRVHDVIEAKQVITLMSQYSKA
ncbi:MAG: dihydropteroate synthase [Bacteroidia bacterium]